CFSNPCPAPSRAREQQREMQQLSHTPELPYGDAHVIKTPAFVSRPPRLLRLAFEQAARERPRRRFGTMRDAQAEVVRGVAEPESVPERLDGNGACLRRTPGDGIALKAALERGLEVVRKGGVQQRRGVGEPHAPAVRSNPRTVAVPRLQDVEIEVERHRRV